MATKTFTGSLPRYCQSNERGWETSTNYIYGDYPDQSQVTQWIEEFGKS